jgi:hypothetical protein
MNLPLLPFKTLFIDRGLPGLIVEEKDFGGKPVRKVEWYSDYYKMVHDTDTYYFFQEEALRFMIVQPWDKLFVRADQNGKVPGHPPRYQRHVHVDWTKIHPDFSANLRAAVYHWEVKGNHHWREMLDTIYMQSLQTDMTDPSYAEAYNLMMNLRKMMWL